MSLVFPKKRTGQWCESGETPHQETGNRVAVDKKDAKENHAMPAQNMVLSLEP